MTTTTDDQQAMETGAFTDELVDDHAGVRKSIVKFKKPKDRELYPEAAKPEYRIGERVAILAIGIVTGSGLEAPECEEGEVGELERVQTVEFRRVVILSDAQVLAAEGAAGTTKAKDDPKPKADKAAKAPAAPKAGTKPKLAAVPDPDTVPPAEESKPAKATKAKAPAKPRKSRAKVKDDGTPPPAPLPKRDDVEAAAAAVGIDPADALAPDDDDQVPVAAEAAAPEAPPETWTAARHPDSPGAWRPKLAGGVLSRPECIELMGLWPMEDYGITDGCEHLLESGAYAVFTLDATANGDADVQGDLDSEADDDTVPVIAPPEAVAGSAAVPEAEADTPFPRSEEELEALPIEELRALLVQYGVSNPPTGDQETLVSMVLTMQEV